MLLSIVNFQLRFIDRALTTRMIPPGGDLGICVLVELVLLLHRETGKLTEAIDPVRSQPQTSLVEIRLGVRSSEEVGERSSEACRSE